MTCALDGQSNRPAGPPRFRLTARQLGADVADGRRCRRAWRSRPAGPRAARRAAPPATDPPRTPRRARASRGSARETRSAVTLAAHAAPAPRGAGVAAAIGVIAAAMLVTVTRSRRDVEVGGEAGRADRRHVAAAVRALPTNRGDVKMPPIVAVASSGPVVLSTIAGAFSPKSAAYRAVSPMSVVASVRSPSNVDRLAASRFQTPPMRPSTRAAPSR